jgi:two-component system, chemotaxis family, protein-glutamate methylesterase/glutaminase
MTRHLINGTCPECRGPLTEVQEQNIVEYECLVGHRYTPKALLHAHAETEERALWAAILALEEAQNLVAAVQPHVPQAIRESLRADAEGKTIQAERVREIVHELTPFRTD